MENKIMVMRRALRDVSRVAEEMTRGTMTGDSVDRKTVDAWAMRLCEIISRDLEIPLRNCDVGTVKEQSDRFAEFCKKHAKGCGLGYGSKGIGHPKVTCPAFKGMECAIVWSQMLYEAKEGMRK